MLSYFYLYWFYVKTTLPPITETEKTLIKSFNFEDSLQSLYAWMPVLRGVRSDTQLWTLILQTPAFKQQGRKPFCELKVIRRGGCSFTNSVLRHLQLWRGQEVESSFQYVVQWLGLFSIARSWKPYASQRLCLSKATLLKTGELLNLNLTFCRGCLQWQEWPYKSVYFAELGRQGCHWKSENVHTCCWGEEWRWWHHSGCWKLGKCRSVESKISRTVQPTD